MTRGGAPAGREGGVDQEFQLEARHLTFLILLVVVLCVASFMLGRWVERQSIGPAVAGAATGEREGSGTVEEMGDVGQDLTFFDSLKTEKPVGLDAPAAAQAIVPRPSPAASSAPARREASRSVGEGIMIQVFASKDRGSADAVRKRLRGKGYTALLVQEKGTWKVRVGPYADREEAERTASVLRDQERLSTWIP